MLREAPPISDGLTRCDSSQGKCHRPRSYRFMEIMARGSALHRGGGNMANAFDVHIVFNLGVTNLPPEEFTARQAESCVRPPLFCLNFAARTTKLCGIGSPQTIFASTAERSVACISHVLLKVLIAPSMCTSRSTCTAFHRRSTHISSFAIDAMHDPSRLFLS